jgi:hypothetical protein
LRPSVPFITPSSPRWVTKPISTSAAGICTPGEHDEQRLLHAARPHRHPPELLLHALRERARLVEVLGRDHVAEQRDERVGERVDLRPRLGGERAVLALRHARGARIARLEREEVGLAAVDARVGDALAWIETNRSPRASLAIAVRCSSGTRTSASRVITT